MSPTTPSRTLIVIVGPTAVGKTAACITLAQKLHAAIVSADSRQFYQGMSIGTAKPTAEERAAAPHHFIDFLPLEEPYSAGRYAQEALPLLDKLWENSPYVILTGGSGLYIDALCNGLPQMPSVPARITQELEAAYAAEGLAPLVKELASKDPVYYQQVDRHNAKRIIRALGVCRATGQRFSLFRGQKIAPRHFQTIKIGLTRPREELYARINQRVDAMVREGLFEEIEALYPYRRLPSLATIAYREGFGYMEGRYDKARAIELIKQHTRQYAKRQLTWFKRDPTIHWFAPDQIAAIEQLITHSFRTL